MRRFSISVTIGGKHGLYTIEQVSSTVLNARHILEQYQLGRIVGERLQHEKHSSHGKTIKGLIFG
jgi:hypothetical protein